MDAIYVIGTFLITLFMGMPVAFSLGLSGMVAINLLGVPLTTVPQNLWDQLTSFPYLAVPFFLLAGHLMNDAGITKKLVDLANLLVGRIKGGLAHTNIVASMFFAGITGTALGDTAAIGSMIIPAMVDEGYDRDFSVAVTASSSLVGPIIPPSLLMIILGVVAEESISTLFVAGYVPGILLALSLMLVAYIQSKRRNYPVREEKFTFSEVAKIVKEAIIPLGMPIIILGGILSGVFTATESAAVAVVYALIVGLFITKGLKFKDLPKYFVEAALLTAALHLIVAMSGVTGWAVTVYQVPQHAAELITSISDSYVVTLLMINLLLLFVGMLMEPTVSIIILVPILFPVVQMLGVHTIHFGIVMVLNLVIGLATPPVGLVLFTASKVGNIELEPLMKGMIPYLIALLIVLLLITFIPALTLFIPEMFGLI